MLYLKPYSLNNTTGVKYVAIRFRLTKMHAGNKLFCKFTPGKYQIITPPDIARYIVKQVLQINIFSAFWIPAFSQAKLDFSKPVGDYGWIIKNIDKETGDTIIFNPSTEEYLRVTKKGIKVIEGKMQTVTGHKCGHEPAKNGIWIERYRNGKLLCIGNYECGLKVP